MKKILFILMALVMGSTFIMGCAPRVLNDPDTLEIYILDVGYGTDWLDAIIDDFKQQPWVKEKYPNLDIPDYQTNSEESFAPDRINVGERNTVDLFFTTNPYDLFTTVYKGEPVLEDVTDIYDLPVPGEDMKFADKMLDTVLYSCQIIDHNGDIKYLGVPWAGGMDGILYNMDILDSLDMEVPLTTNEFIKLCDDIKQLKGDASAPYSYGHSIISSAHGGAYWRFIFPIWWAQYEGVNEYENFWNGVYDGAISKDIFRQTGRREALRVMESLLSVHNGYFTEESAIHDFKTAQNRFLMGEGVFHANGDWFDMENHTTKEGLVSKGYDYDIGMMRTPVISAIVNRTPSLRAKVQAANPGADEAVLKTKYDQELADIVSAGDAGQTSYAGISTADFNKIAAARTVVESIGPRHLGIIPSYATAKEPAKDLLRFLATDRANKLYTQSTMGAALPFKYDIKTQEPEIYESLSPIHKTRNEVFGNTVHEVTILPAEMRYPLALYGGLIPYTMMGNMEVGFLKADHLSADEIHQKEIDHWNEERWTILKANAGL